MNLKAHINRQPIMDAPFERHLRTDEFFKEVEKAREEYWQAIEAREHSVEKELEAQQRYHKAKAKAELMASMEGL